MICGVGTDIVEISRMQKSIQSTSFYNRCFSAKEQAMLATRRLETRRAASAAANFAAKEAFLKAAHKGLGSFLLVDIAILRKKNGQPYYDCTGKAALYLKENQITPHLSLTHDAGIAMAYVIFETTKML